MVNRKYGFHSGVVHAKAMEVEGDFTIQGDIVFGGVSAGAIAVTGGIDLSGTTSAIGIELSGGTFSSGAIRLGDDDKLLFGAGNDASFEYDENGTDNLRYDGADMIFDTATKLLFRDSGLYVYSSTDGQLDIVADTTLALSGAITTDSSITMTMAGTENLNIVNATLGSSTKGVYVEMESGSATAGSRQGALHIELGRSTVMTGSDGNPDCALKVSSNDWSDAGSGYARIRGLDLKAQNDGENGNSTVFINGAYITAECATGMANSGDMTVAEFNMKNNGTITGESIGLKINDESQGSVTGDTIGLLISSSAYAITREHAIEIGSGAGSWTNILHLTDDDHTNLIKADVEAGCVGTVRGTPNQTATCDGSLKVDINGNTLYIPLYNAITAS